MMIITGWRWRLAAILAVGVGMALTVRTLLESSDPTQPAPLEDPVTVSSVLLAVTDTVLFVDFATRPQAGTLSLERGTSETDVTAVMQGGSGVDELVAFGNSVRVVNTAQSTADYSITVPSRIVLVEVRIDRAVIARHRPEGAEDIWTLELVE